MILIILLLSFVIVMGVGFAIFDYIFITFAAYTQNIISLSSWSGREDDTFFHGWTVFYWAWWISWSPFVGMFIARVSKGRTVREFLIAVLLVPTLVSLVWMAAFGGSALIQVETNVGALVNGITKVELSMF